MAFPFFPRPRRRRVSFNISRFGLAAWLFSSAEVRSLGWWVGYWKFRLFGVCVCGAGRGCGGCRLGWEAGRAL